MNRPWMPLNIADYLRDTSHLRALESGAYLHLIMAYWVGSGLPKDDRQLATIAKLTDREWKSCKPTLAAFFGPDWSSHKRIDYELSKVAEVSSKRRASAMQMHSKRDANAGANAHTLNTKQREDKTADAASAGYGFEGGIIKLSRKHFSDWTEAFKNLDLRGELTARDAWLGSQRATDSDRSNWFISTSKYLANRNMEARAKSAPPTRPLSPFGTEYPDGIM